MKNLSKTKLAVLAIGLLSCGLFCQQAQAKLMPSGSIKFSGLVTLSKPNSMTSSLMFGAVSVTRATGDYASVTIGKMVNFTNFTFDDNSLETTPFDLKLWDFFVDEKHYTFDHLVLQQGSIVHVGNGGRPWNFRLSGIGEAFISGFTFPAEMGSFFMSGTGTGPQVTFTAIFQAFNPSVPDGGSAVALLGIALAGLEGLRRKLCAS